jgi:secreted trypsin-like serine protease
MTPKQRLSRSDKALVALAVICIVLSVISFLTACKDTASDSYVRNRVLQLKSHKDACTGVQVKAPSGNVYTLTAAHCKIILDDDSSVMSTDERGNEKRIYMLDIDEGKDLMLMTSPNAKSIDIANKTYKHEHIHTMTHGHMHASYRTDGELLEEQKLTVPENINFSDADTKECNAKQWHESVDSGFVSYCVRDFYEMMTSAQVYPGSSGGPILDDQGKLVGIVSISEEGTIYSGSVTLKQIQSFLKLR